VIRETPLFLRKRPVTNHPPSLMPWGCISTQGIGLLHFVEGTLLMASICRSLKTSFCLIWIVYQNLFDNELLEVLPWPGNSPDMNPIENCWERLKQLVYGRFNPNLEVFRRNIEEHWNSGESLNQIVKSSFSSMPHRIRDLLLERGDGTKN